MPSSLRRTARLYGRDCAGMVLVEVIVAVVILGALLAVAMPNMTGLALRSEFKRQAQDFINVLKMAQNASAESSQRYAVVLDFDEQTYTMIPFATIDKARIWEEEQPITTGHFTPDFQVDYILFDDGVDTRSWNITESDYFRVWLMAGRSGWQNGGKIVALDSDGNPWSILFNRFSRDIRLVPGDVDILAPQENVLF